MIDRESSWLARPVRASAGRLLRFPLNITERRWLLIGLDVLAVNAALLLALAIRARQAPSLVLVAVHPGWFVILTGIWLVTAHALDAYEPKGGGRLEATAPLMVRVALVTSILYLLVPRYTPALPTSRLALLSFPVLAVGAVLLGRRAFAWALPRPVYERQTLIVGAGWAGRTVAGELLRDPHAGYDVIGFIDDDPEKTGASIALADPDRAQGAGEQEAALPVLAPDVEKRGATLPVLARGVEQRRATLPVLGNRQQVKELIAAHRVSTLILAITRDVDSDLLQILMDCAEKGVEMIPMPVVYEQLTGRVPVEHVGEKWYVAVPIHPKTTGTLWGFVKRAMDIVLATTGLVLLLPLWPLIALAIVLESPGPVFYLQKRVGRGGRVFRAVKFRSMKWGAAPSRRLLRGRFWGRFWLSKYAGWSGGAEPRGPEWVQENDTRVTRVGRILRAAHIDEFPQFLNVLKGEMSIVGPRPERPTIVERLAAQLPIYRLRHIVKPGMGGWGLVRQGYVGSHEDALIRLQYDLYYIKHQSLWLDLLIILKTIMHAVTLKGR